MFSVSDWSAFLREWDREVVELLRDAPPSMRGRVAAAVLERGTMLRPSATEEAIHSAEKLLAMPLPASVRRFYQATNGMAFIGLDAEDGSLLPVEKIGRLSERDPQMLADMDPGGRSAPDADYFHYGAGQKTFALRSEYFRTLIQLSEWVDARMYLLNPRVVQPDGEWEAWYYAPSLPGARRFRTFEEMLVDERPRSLRNKRHGIEVARRRP